MAGGAFFVPGAGGDEEYEGSGSGRTAGEGAHAVQWVGKAGVRGPRWARMPLLTAGMLGIQCVWSIEMGYASPYLLDLGLSKSHMSLVFMAGPLSGLIVQPLIGVFADRCRSPWGRRRPFMIAGILICAFAMMMLGWARELSALLHGGSNLAIGFAVFSIYLIDFSINAVMSTDRALVVDTLPPAQQEEGSAWAGRMFGLGSVLGFFVGGLDLTTILPFLGNTQIQILSFLTSATLLFTHVFTAWAVSERVLLRDDRAHSQSNLWANIRAIWDNIFALPPGIQTVCIIQFFNFLAWFPTLFFTSVWVSEIYTASMPSEGIDPKVFAADAVRSGNRALFLQAIVVIIVSIGAPFLVAESGVQVSFAQNEYEALGAEEDGPRMGGSRREAGNIGSSFDRRRGEGVLGLVKNLVGGLIERVRSGRTFEVPIKGLTLVKLWSVSMFTFSIAMGLTWFVSTVGQAYVVIAICGASWSLTNWAPFSLIGELILIDGQIDRSNGGMALGPLPRSSLDEQYRSTASEPLPPAYSRSVSATTADRPRPITPRGDINPARSSLEFKLQNSPSIVSGSSRSLSRARPPTPLRVQQLERSIKVGPDIDDEDDDDGADDDSHENSLILRHSDEETERPLTPLSPISPRQTIQNGKSTADKAGVILGIHNVFVVLPQFLVTGMSAVIFSLMEPDINRDIPKTHPLAGPPVGNATAGVDLGLGSGGVGAVLDRLVRRAEGLVEASSPDAVGLIFRIGGISAAVGGVICWRLSRRWARGEGI